MQRVHHRLPLDPQYLAIVHGSRRAHAQNLTRQRTLAKKMSLTHNGESRLLACLRHHGEPDFALLNIEDGVRLVPLREYKLFPGNREDLPAVADRRKKGIRIEIDRGSGAHRESV